MTKIIFEICIDLPTAEWHFGNRCFALFLIDLKVVASIMCFECVMQRFVLCRGIYEL